MKTENWNGYEIRFVAKDGKWYAVASDVCNALGLKQITRAMNGLSGVTKSKVRSGGEMREVNIIPEKDIYRLVFKSRKPEAEDFQDWVMDAIEELRMKSGLEGFQVFRMLDKEHQKQMMEKLRTSLKNPQKLDYIKANRITNRAIANKYGLKTSIKKDDMNAQMLVDREPILQDTVELMGAKDKFDLNISISERIYAKYDAK